MKLFLGSKYERLDILKKSSAKYICVSYNEFYNKKHEIDKFIDKCNEYDLKIFLESGAKSWFDNYKTQDTIDAYTNIYIEFLNKYKDSFFVYEEFSDGPYTLIKSLREKYRLNGLSPLLTIRQDFKEYAEDTLQDSLDFCKYVGLSRDISDDFCSSFFNKNREYLKQNKIIIHGFSRTSKDILKKLPFYSINTYNWINGHRYGETYVFERGEIISHHKDQKEDIRFSLKKKVEDTNIVDSDKFINDDSYNVNLWNCIQWVKLADHLDNKKGYWDMEESKELIKTGGEIIAKETHNEVVLTTRRCDFCEVSGECQFFRPGELCSIDNSSIETDLVNINQKIATLINLGVSRIHHAMNVEKMRGEVLDPRISKEIDKVMGWLKVCKELGESSDKISIEAKGNGTSALGSLLARALGSNIESSSVCINRKVSNREEDNRNATVIVSKVVEDIIEEN